MAGEQSMVERGDRPSRHGQLLGKTLAAIVDAGRRATRNPPDICATCAFRAGSLPNQTAGTGMLALNIVLGIDTDDFACHHGMKDGKPTKLCIGSLLAKRAPWPAVKALISDLKSQADCIHGEDLVRTAFDAWADRVDPEGKLDVYQLARVYARDAALAQHTPAPETDADAAGGGR